ncbi:hypothetical protein JST97_38550 [bacterium]|nr:hypothetical protein [bacterium]
MDEEFPLRLYLLAQGEIAPGFIPEWLLVWHFSQVSAQELVHTHHASPQRRALAVQRHHPRYRHDLQVCLTGVREALHPQLRLVWCLQLLQHEAQSEILRLLAQPELESDLVGALAWTLACYGREIVLPICELFPAAFKSVRDRYCQALWYLGREARGCERWLSVHDSPWSRALLYRLEGWGTKLLMQWGAAPLYLDSFSLEALAARAFSLNASERWYAIEALLGWGPGLPQAAELLEALALDRDQDFARSALLGMRRLHYRPQLSTVRSLLLSGPTEVAQLAVQIFFQELESVEPEVVQEALTAVSSAPERPLEHLLSELEPELLLKARIFCVSRSHQLSKYRDFCAHSWPTGPIGSTGANWRKRCWLLVPLPGSCWTTCRTILWRRSLFSQRPGTSCWSWCSIERSDARFVGVINCSTPWSAGRPTAFSSWWMCWPALNHLCWRS